MANALEVVVGLLLVATILLSMRGSHPADSFASEQEEEASECFPALFSFGSSVADTGTVATALPFDRSNRPPYGSTFFGKPSKRFSDGRLHIDFWALALGLPFLDPYLKSVGSNFRRGANFAAGGATAANFTLSSPFSLSTQLNQFREFKKDVLSLISKQGVSSKSQKYPNLPNAKHFRDALYVIAIGGNDFLRWYFYDNLTLEEVELRVPEISESILRVVEALYAEGARNILVEDVFPQGCIPRLLSTFASDYSHHLDAAGCLTPFNAMVQLHNSLLNQRISALSKRLEDASIAVIDTFSKRYEIIANHEQYGFEVPLKACCGTGGDYNYRSDCACGNSVLVDGQVIEAAVCEKISSHIMWDGVHFTDAFNLEVMRSILSGNHFEPSFDLKQESCIFADDVFNW